MKVFCKLGACVVLRAGTTWAQPAVPGQGPTPLENWLGPILIPLIVGTAGLVALIVFVVWRMVVRMRRRQGPPRPEF